MRRWKPPEERSEDDDFDYTGAFAETFAAAAKVLAILLIRPRIAPYHALVEGQPLSLTSADLPCDRAILRRGWSRFTRPSPRLRTARAPPLATSG